MRCALSLASLMLLTSAAALAHQDHGARFVAADGADAGGCKTPQTACLTIGYAAAQAGKGEQVRVAEGRYPIEDLTDLYYLKTDAADLRGGYSRDFERRSPDQHPTVLIGVLAELRQRLSGRGFQVIVDRKWFDFMDRRPDVARLEAVLAPMHASTTQTDCIGGQAAGFDCSNIDLLSHVALADFSINPARANDIWGFLDLNTEREYAIIGLRNGAAVVDVTDPTAPREIGAVSGTQTGWRDVKVLQWYQNDRWHARAYVTADASTDRIMIIDLDELPNSIRLLGQVTNDLSAHNVNIAHLEPAFGIALADGDPVLYLAGSNVEGGQFRAFSLKSPDAPALVARSPSGDYMHDGTTALLTDAAQIAACPNATSICEVLADFNETTIDLHDVTDPANPFPLASVGYPNASYAHSGSWSEDGRYLYAHDELDERDAGQLTTVRAFDVSNLRQPQLVGTWTGPDRVIDHNGYPRGNRYYISNYTRGLTVLDISDPAQMQRVGHFDTFTVNNNTAFSGAWGVYPYLPSRVILISDIEAGLFVLRDATRSSPAGTLSLALPYTGAREGNDAELSVSRSGGSAGNVSVGWEVLAGSADAADITLTRGRLFWANGNSGDRRIVVPTTADGGGEGLERAFVRLYDPRGGATLGDVAIASVFVDEAGAATTLQAFNALVSAAEGGRVYVTITRRGSAAGEARVDYTTEAGSALAGADFQPAAGQLVWPDGDATARNVAIDLIDDLDEEAAESFVLRLSNASGAALAGDVVTVQIAASDANIGPIAAAGADQSVVEGANVRLDGGGSSDPNGDALSYTWQQMTGFLVQLQGANNAVATFTAPAVGVGGTQLRFRLTVDDGRGLSSIDEVIVTVRNANGPSSGGSGGAMLWLLLAAPLALLRRRRFR